MTNKEYIESIMEKYNIKYEKKLFKPIGTPNTRDGYVYPPNVSDEYGFSTKYYTAINFHIWEQRGFFNIKVEGTSSFGTRFFNFEMLSGGKDKNYILECLEKHIPILKKGVLASDRMARKEKREKEKREKLEQERLQSLAKKGLIKFERYGTYTVIGEKDNDDDE